MTWLQFIATVIGHLAWPSVIVVLLIVLRSHVGALAERLDKFKFGSTEVSFKEGLVKGLKNIIEAPPPPELSKPEPELPLSDAPKQLENSKGVRHRTTDKEAGRIDIGSDVPWNSDHAAEVLTAHERVVALLIEIGKALNIGINNADLVMATLANGRYVSREIRNLYKAISDGRNLVAHARVLPPQGEIAEYVRQAEYLLRQLEVLKEKIDRGDVKP